MLVSKTQVATKEFRQYLRGNRSFTDLAFLGNLFSILLVVVIMYLSNCLRKVLAGFLFFVLETVNLRRARTVLRTNLLLRGSLPRGLLLCNFLLSCRLFGRRRLLGFLLCFIFNV